jgi:glycosyltransferase involved in cell wall biosynthesis
MNKTLVAIKCTVYNHEPYLRDCLEGFVMQQTNFPFVAIVHDDASTDNSAAIIREYEEKYPDIIKPIYEAENQYSKRDGSLGRIMNAAVDAIGAKYVAMCEGDDYWTDPLKLQKQVDFMEANPEYSLCLTNSIVKFDDREVLAINHIWDTYTIEDVLNTNALNIKSRGDNIVPCGHTSTIFYKKPNKEYPHWMSKCFIGDEPLMIYLAHHGKVKFINEVTSVYRAGVGVSSRNFNQELDWKNRIKMYEVINEGLGYQYKEIINSIIAQFYFKLCKWNWKRNCKIEAIKFFLHTIKNDYRVVLKKIQNKI